MRRRLLLGASFSALATAAQAQVRLFGPQPPGAAIGRHGRPTYGPSPLGVPPPTLDFNFLTGALDPAITFSRSDTFPVASYTDASGTLRYGPTNQTSPSVNTGTWGIVGEGTSTVNNITAPNGTLTGSRLVAGATNAIHAYTLGGGTPAPSAPYTLSVYAKQGAGTTKIGVQLRATDWSGGDVKGAFDLSAVTAAVTTSNGTATITDVGNGWFRCSVTGTSLASGLSGAALWLPVLRADGSETYVGSGETAYFWGVQFEQGPTATAYIPTTAGAVSGPRFDYSPNTTTNYMRNSVMAGAAGPSTPPTSWGLIDGLGAASNGMTVTVIGTGTESGISYIDMRWQGTATATTNIFCRMESNTQIAAYVGQTWTMGVNIRVMAGSIANLSVNGVQVFVGERDSGGASTGFTSPATVPQPTGAALSTQRFTQSRTNSAPTTAFELPAIALGITSGQVYDFTLRIGAPQLELGATANAFVPTSGAAAGAGATLRGLLIEESRINLLFPSADITTCFGGKSNVTLTAAQGTAPDGANTMARLVETAVTNVHVAWGGATVTASAIYTFSVFAKAQQNQFLQLIYDDSTLANGCWANFDLIAGTVSLAIAPRGTGTATAAAIQAMGNGIYRCSITGSIGAFTTATTRTCLIPAGNSSITASYAGNTANGLLVWGAQFELGLLPTSYIPAVGVAVTRSGDTAIATIAPPTTFSVAGEAMVPVLVNGVTMGIANADDGTSVNRVPLRISNLVYNAASVVSSTATATQSGGSPAPNTILKAAYVSNGSASTLTLAYAGTVAANVSGAQPAGLTQLRPGANQSNSTNALNGWVRRTRYWPQALTNQQLVQVTT